MESAEIQMYEHQLSSVEQALEVDPTDSELLNLKQELTDLIDLTRQLAQQQAGPSVPSAGSKDRKGKREAAPDKEVEPSWKSGDQVMARYKDGKFYPARITSIGGSPTSPIYTIVFKSYDSTEQVSSSDLKPLKQTDSTNPKKRTLETSSSTNPSSGFSSPLPPPPSSSGIGNSSSPLPPPPPSEFQPPPPPPPGMTSGSTSKPIGSTEDQERERKKRRNEKKNERNQTKSEEAKGKQQSWQKFAKKGAQKGKSGVGKESMFKTPDDPLAKVGIIGAGRGMTAQGSRSKHVYEEK